MRYQLPAGVEKALTDAGYRPGAVIGAGMEGVVVDLGDDLVAKTWHVRQAGDLERLRSFYEAVARSGFALATPSIVRVLPAGRHQATVERKLRGRPLREQMGDRSYPLTSTTVRCVVQVLAALREAVPTEAMISLPVLEGEPPFDPALPFGSSLADLVERRTRRFHAVLLRAVPDLDRLVVAVASQLQAMRSDGRALVHGDLIPANILVDESSAPVGLLDFGFLTTVGDPRFDAAVAASIFDMYGPRGRTSEAVLDDAVIDRFDYEQETLHTYRAAYALATSNCFSASGGDGHFAWCVEMLNRPAVRTSLGI